MFEPQFCYNIKSIEESSIGGYIRIISDEGNKLWKCYIRIRIDDRFFSINNRTMFIDVLTGFWETSEGYVKIQCHKEPKFLRARSPNYCISEFIIEDVGIVYVDNLDVIEKLGEKLIL